MEKRTILGLGILVWFAGFFKESTTGVVRRTFGTLLATVLLLLLSGVAPKVAAGMAWIMAIAIIAMEADSIVGTIDKALKPPWQTISVPNLTPHG